MKINENAKLLELTSFYPRPAMSDADDLKRLIRVSGTLMAFKVDGYIYNNIII